MRGLAWVLLTAHEVHGPIVFLEPAVLEKESFILVLVPAAFLAGTNI